MYLSALEMLGIILLLIACLATIGYATYKNAQLERENINLRRLNRLTRQGLTHE